MDPRKVRHMDTMRTLWSRADSFELRNNIVNPFHFAVFSAFARLRPRSENRENMGTLRLPGKLTTLDVVDVVFADARGRRRRQTCEVKDLEGFKNHFAKHRAPNGERIRSISAPRQMEAILRDRYPDSNVEMK
jgi:hypothetical protein